MKCKAIQAALYLFCSIRTRAFSFPRVSGRFPPAEDSGCPEDLWHPKPPLSGQIPQSPAQESNPMKDQPDQARDLSQIQQYIIVMCWPHYAVSQLALFSSQHLNVLALFCLISEAFASLAFATCK